MNTFFNTPKSERHLFNGKLIKIAEIDPPTVIINDGTFTKGIRLPPSKIDPTTSPMPNINPTIVAMSNLMTLKVCPFEIRIKNQHGICYRYRSNLGAIAIITIAGVNKLATMRRITGLCRRSRVGGVWRVGRQPVRESFARIRLVWGPRKLPFAPDGHVNKSR